MMTDEKRKALGEILKQDVSRFSKVSDEEMAQFPAECSEMEIPTSQGPSKVYVFSYGEVSAKRPLILNFHGGGFIGKHMDRDDLFCRRLACTFNALVLDVDYRLAPEYPYPAAVNESWDVAAWIWNNRETLIFDPDLFILTGHSSGGNLAAGICMRAGETGLFKPCCLVIDYPPLDLFTDPVKKKQSILDMPAERAQMYNAKYISAERSQEPLASPVYASAELLEAFPPTLIISAGEDRLCEEDEEFALHLARAGVAVTCKRFTESVHGFIINRMCEWQEGTRMVTNFITQQLNEKKGN